MRLIDADALKRDFIGKTDRYFDVCEVVDSQPSIEPIVVNNHRWIPVGERLPNADEMSKCLYVNSCGAYMSEAYIYEVGGTYNCENDYTILCDVVAWMPLPEPYKESD